jgi:hypothetical protein
MIFIGEMKMPAIKLILLYFLIGPISLFAQNDRGNQEALLNMLNNYNFERLNEGKKGPPLFNTLAEKLSVEEYQDLLSEIHLRYDLNEKKYFLRTQFLEYKMWEHYLKTQDDPYWDNHVQKFVHFDYGDFEEEIKQLFAPIDFKKEVERRLQGHLGEDTYSHLMTPVKKRGFSWYGISTRLDEWENHLSPLDRTEMLDQFFYALRSTIREEAKKGTFEKSSEGFKKIMTSLYDIYQREKNLKKIGSDSVYTDIEKIGHYANGTLVLTELQGAKGKEVLYHYMTREEAFLEAFVTFLKKEPYVYEIFLQYITNNKFAYPLGRFVNFSVNFDLRKTLRSRVINSRVNHFNEIKDLFDLRLFKIYNETKKEIFEKSKKIDSLIQKIYKEEYAGRLSLPLGTGGELTEVKGVDGGLTLVQGGHVTTMAPGDPGACEAGHLTRFLRWLGLKKKPF